MSVISFDPSLDKNTVLERARAAILAREQYVAALFDTAETAAAAQAEAQRTAAAAAAAAAAFDTAYRDALDAGWTSKELDATGLPTPAIKNSTGSKTGKPSRRSATGNRRSRSTPAVDPDVSVTPPASATTSAAAPAVATDEHAR